MKFETFIKKNLSFLRNVTGTTVIYGASAALNYLFNILLLRGLAPEAFGTYSSALGIITLMGIPSLAISSAVTKLIAKHHGKHLKSFKKKIFLQFLVISTVISTIFYLLSPYISDVTNIPSKYIFALTLVFFLSFFHPITKGILYGLDRPVKASFLFLIESVLKILICVVSLKFLDNDITFPILACGLPFILTGFLLLPFIGKKQENGNGFIVESINFKDTLIYSLMFLFLTVPYTLDISLVNPDFRPEYSALSLVEKVVFFAAISISSVMFARIANLKEKKEKEHTLYISLGITFFIGIVISLLYILFPNIISTVILKGEYTDILKYLGTFGLGITLYAITYLIYNYFILINYTKSLIWIVITSLIQIGLFTFRNNSLEQVVQNQMFLFILLFIGSFIMLVWKLREKDLGDTGIEPVTPTM